jgi:hypothetical protein
LVRHWAQMTEDSSSCHAGVQSASHITHRTSLKHIPQHGAPNAPAQLHWKGLPARDVGLHRCLPPVCISQPNRRPEHAALCDHSSCRRRGRQGSSHLGETEQGGCSSAHRCVCGGVLKRGDPCAHTVQPTNQHCVSACVRLPVESYRRDVPGLAMSRLTQPAHLSL